MKFFFRQAMRFDWLLIASALFLMGVSLLGLYSFSATLSGNDFFLRQALFAGVSLGAMFFLATTDYRHLARLSSPLYFLTLGVLLLVLFIGEPVRGTVGWLSFGAFQVQPVEFAKLSLIIFLASFISKKQSELGEWTRLIASLFLTALIILLVMRQPDLGSSVVLAGIWLAMILASGVRFKHMVVLGCLGFALVGGSWFLLEDYQKARVETFLNPELDPQGSGYNVLQSMIAVGSGGFSGKGIGQGTQSQLSFLPEKHTDFIFAVLAEELGLIGALLVVVVYGLLLYRVKRIGELASDNTGYLIAIGVLALFFTHITINLGMNIGLLPVTGLPAPFLSYGGSALLAMTSALGLLLSIYRYRREEQDMLFSLERPSIEL